MKVDRVKILGLFDTVKVMWEKYTHGVHASPLNDSVPSALIPSQFTYIYGKIIAESHINLLINRVKFSIFAVYNEL